MKNRLLVLSVAFALAACGGGSDSASSPPPAPAPSPSPASCTSSPVVTDATTYLGVLTNGAVGQWRFDTATGTSSVTVNGTTASPTLTRDTAACTYTSSGTATYKTAFTGNGFAVSSAAVGGANLPALLVADPTSDLYTLAGTYNVLRYVTERTTTSTTIQSDYATFNLDTAGNWSLCPNAAFSASCGGPTGTLSVDAAGGFDIVMGGATVGRLLAKVAGTSKAFIVSIQNTADASDTIVGLWVGSLNTPFASGAVDGTYATSSTDPSSNTVTISGLTGRASDSTSSATLIPNSPVQGLFSIAGADPVDDIGLLSDLGLYAAVTPPALGAPAFLQFGVKQ
jgi:hypothetical protein